MKPLSTAPPAINAASAAAPSQVVFLRFDED
jgi:hypothetical protein